MPANDETQSLNRSLSADEDPRLIAAVQEYVAAVEAGRKPNRRELLERNPDIADELSACLQGLAFLNSAVAQIDQSNANTVGACRFDAQTAEDMETGRPLGDFRLVRELGRGGMGIIYEAIQLSLGRRVALKVLPLASALDPRHLQRFRNEAQAAAHLHHTNIVPVYAVGCERSVHFYAMQLIEGQSLSDVIRALRGKGNRLGGESDAAQPQPPTAPPALAAFLRRGGDTPGGSPAQQTTPSPPRADIAPADSLDQLSAMRAVSRSSFFRSVARLGKQAAEALEYAHQQGVVHRDIKPANLMLDLRGTLWITDFGLAQMYVDSGLTQPGDMLGTLRYMSPEQAAGRAVVLDQRTDVYSLGATLYEFLTLQPAFPGELRGPLIEAINNQDPKPPRDVDRTIPPELETIMLKAMSKSPGDRYQTAGEMAADLERFLQDQPIRARRPTLREKAVKWARRHRPLVAAAAAVLVLAMIGLLVTTLLVTREQARTEEAYLAERRRAAEASAERVRAEASRREAHRIIGAFTQFAASDFPKDPRFLRQRRLVLETALAYDRAFLEARQNDPTAAAEVADVRQWAKEAADELTFINELSKTELALALLLETDVCVDLQLTPGQTEALQKQANEFFTTPPSGFTEVSSNGGKASPARRVETAPSGLSHEQRRNELLKDAAIHLEALETELTPEQSRRLRQISRQVRGVFSFNDADVVAALMLTPAQQEVVRHEESSLVEVEHQGPFRVPQEVVALQTKAAIARIVASLTPSQQDAWKTMVGPPYEGSVPSDVWTPGIRRFRGSGPGHGPDGGPGHGPPPDGFDGKGGPGGHGPKFGPDGPDRFHQH